MIADAPLPVPPIDVRTWWRVDDRLVRACATPVGEDDGYVVGESETPGDALEDLFRRCARP